jgi:hypothetical protein
MPAHKAANSSKKAINKAVGKNMHELSKKGAKKRSRSQKIAIAISEAKKK